MTPKLTVRPHSRRDIPLRVKWLNNPAVDLVVSDTPGKGTTLKKQQTWFDAYAKDGAKKFFTMCVGGQPIGFMGLKNISHDNRNAELFIAIGEDDFRGRGFGHQSLTWLLDYAFHKLKLHKSLSQ